MSQKESYGFSVLGCSPVLISRVESGESRRVMSSVCLAVVLCSSAESSQVSQRESYGFSVLGCSPVLISRVESGESERELWLQCARL